MVDVLVGIGSDRDSLEGARAVRKGGARLTVGATEREGRVYSTRPQAAVNKTNDMPKKKSILHSGYVELEKQGSQEVRVLRKAASDPIRDMLQTSPVVNLFFSGLRIISAFGLLFTFRSLYCIRRTPRARGGCSSQVCAFHFYKRST